MRSPPCRPRIHIRPGRYWAHELSRLPTAKTIRTFAHENTATDESAAPEARATRHQKDYQREARRTSIVQLAICHRLHRQEQPRPTGSPRNRTASMAACSSTARKPSNTRCSRTAITPKPSSSCRAKSNSTWAASSPSPPPAPGASHDKSSVRHPGEPDGQPHSVSNREQVVDTMIGLTRLSNLHRAIVAGSDSLELYLALRRRGFVRVATTATCRIPKRQHAVGLITGQNSLPAIEAALAQISQFLCASAAIAVLIDSRESGVLPENPQPAGTDGLPDRGRRPVPAGPRAVSLPAGLRPDGKRSVKSDDAPLHIPPSGSRATSPTFPRPSMKRAISIWRHSQGFANARSRRASRRSSSAKPPAKPPR